MDIRGILAVNLRKLRQAQGLSQEELAHRAEIDRTYISALERSVYAAGIDVVDRLARVLGVEAADLLRRPSSSARGKKTAMSGLRRTNSEGARVRDIDPVELDDEARNERTKTPKRKT